MEQKQLQENEDQNSETNSTNKKSSKMNWKKAVVITVCMCLVITALLVGILVPYKTQSTVFEYGFERNGMLPPLVFAYRSDTNKFDIDNVSLSVSFGGFFCYSFSDSIHAYMDVPEFDLFFTNENSECIYLVRHSTENLVSKEYNVDYGQELRMKFNHSEMVTIPKELFNKQRGLLCLCIAGIDFMETDPHYKILSRVYINYTIEKEKIVLSHWDGIRKF